MMPERYVEEATAADGTRFQVNSEQVRGERRTFWIERRDVDSARFVGDGTYDDTHSRRTACLQLARLAAALTEGPDDA